MPWLAVDKDSTESIYEEKPIRRLKEWECTTFGESEWQEFTQYVKLPTGTIEKLIGKSLTWDDNPYEYNTVVKNNMDYLYKNMNFLTSCYINSSNPKLISKLEDLGYINLLHDNINDSNILCCKGIIISCNKSYNNKLKIIDCKNNEELFLALVALRNGTDYMQWFVTHDNKKWYQSYDKISITHYDSTNAWHKATIQELINHFK